MFNVLGYYCLFAVKVSYSGSLNKSSTGSVTMNGIWVQC